MDNSPKYHLYIGKKKKEHLKTFFLTNKQTHMEQQQQAAAATTAASTPSSASSSSSSAAAAVVPEVIGDTTEYWSIFTVDNIKCAVKLEGEHRLIWRAYSSAFKSTPPPILDGSHKSDTVLLLEDVCIVSVVSPTKFLLHCLVVNAKQQPMARVYERHEFTYIGRLGELPVPAGDASAGSWISRLRAAASRLSGYPCLRKPVYVCINPFSGVKKAVQIWESECAPLLKDSGLPYVEHRTEFAGDAMERVKALDLTEYSAIATVGGDGILSEAINGLMARDDWEAAIKTPLAPVPGGTGNATGYSLYYDTTAPCVMCHLVKGCTRPSDLFLATQPSVGRYIWGILSCNYGIVAESDFGSEKIRWAGSLRPSIWAVYRILCGTSYHCKVTYLPTDLPRQDWYNVRCVRDCPHCANALAQLTSDYVSDDHHRSELSSSSLSSSSSSSSASSSDLDSDSSSFSNVAPSSAMPVGSSGDDDDDDDGDNGDDECSLGASPFSSSTTESSSSNNDATTDTPEHRNLRMPQPTVAATTTTITTSSSSTSSSKKSNDGDDDNSKATNSDDGNDNDDGSDLPELPTPKETAPDNEGAENTEDNNNNKKKAEIEEVKYGPQYTTSMSTCDDWAGDVPKKFAELFGGYEHYQPGSAVPSGWAVQENMELTWVSIQKMPWLMPGMYAAPYAHMVDGCLDVSYATTEGFSRISFLKLFTQFADGSFLNSPKLSYMKVRSLTLEPFDETGYVGIDGERIPFVPISVHVAQALMNFVCYV